jgi:predicted Fe-S protein YdhL (DUF1289 family)
MKSPCIGDCRVENGICTGCGRTREQVVQWASYSPSKREQIMADLPDHGDLVAES